MDFSAVFYFISIVLSITVNVDGAETLRAENITAHWIFPKTHNFPLICDTKFKEPGLYERRMLNIFRGEKCHEMMSLWASAASYDASDYEVLYSKRMPVLLPSASRCFSTVMSFWHTCLDHTWYRPSIKFSGFQSFLRFVAFYGHNNLENELSDDYYKCTDAPAAYDSFCKLTYYNADSSRRFADSLFYNTSFIHKESDKLCLAYLKSSQCLRSKAEMCGNQKFINYMKTHFDNLISSFGCNDMFTYSPVNNQYQYHSSGAAGLLSILSIILFTVGGLILS